MIIPLSKFEQVINETILERGLGYFKNGDVTAFAELSNGVYEATVMGTEEYTVSFVVKSDVVEAYHCDCPYDMGPVCKHVVASIFYLKQDELNLDSIKASSPKKKKGKSATQQFKEVLQSVSHNELKAFIMGHSKADKKFKNLFLSNFAHLNKEQSKAFYQKQIKAIVHSATDNDGFIGWNEMKYLEQGIAPIIAVAEKQFDDKNYLNAIYIYTALMEEMTEAIQFSDDSNGVLGGIIDRSYEKLHGISQAEITRPIKTELFDYCISAFEKCLFKGWDWHIGVLHIAHELIDDEEEVDVILDCLGTIDGDYEKERAQAFKLKIISE
ncbi:hypothetical protein OAA06_02270, partial [bacterium]|nr:hypothetical protein [bacterium]